MGIPCFPLAPKSKEPPKGLKFLDRATTDPDLLRLLSQEFPGEANCALLMKAEPGGFCVLEFDKKGGMREACCEYGEGTPQTLTQKSGKGFGHFIFKQTPASIALGNRSALQAEPCACENEARVIAPHCGLFGCKEQERHHHHEWFSFRTHNKYVVAAGSTHPNGRLYMLASPTDPIPCPDWVTKFVAANSMVPKPKSPKGAKPVVDEFDFDAFCNHYGLDVIDIKDDVWHILRHCPGVDRRHEQSRPTGLYYDGETLGWSCFAQTCPTYGMHIGELIRFLNRDHEPYLGPIWDSQPDDEFCQQHGIEQMLNEEEPLPSPEKTAAERQSSSPG